MEGREEKRRERKHAEGGLGLDEAASVFTAPFINQCYLKRHSHLGVLAITTALCHSIRTIRATKPPPSPLTSVYTFILHSDSTYCFRLLFLGCGVSPAVQHLVVGAPEDTCTSLPTYLNDGTLRNPARARGGLCCRWRGGGTGRLAPPPHHHHHHHHHHHYLDT